MLPSVALSRRQWILGVGAVAAAQPRPLLIDSHIHLFNPKRFPYHPRATYRPEPQPLDRYLETARAIGLAGSVIVHPEPYQDDHSSLDYFLAHEPRPRFFQATCLFDPLKLDTPARMAALTRKHPDRIVALRIHQNRPAGEGPWGLDQPIRERDMTDPQMKITWKAATDLGLAIQMHFTPHHAASIGRLAGEFPSTVVILDHMGRAGQGRPEQYEDILALAKHPRTIFKFSGWGYSSKQPPPHRDLQPLVRRAFDAFGPERIVWGGLGMTPREHRVARSVFDAQFEFASADDRAKIEGGNARRLFRFG